MAKACNFEIRLVNGEACERMIDKMAVEVDAMLALLTESDRQQAEPHREAIGGILREGISIERVLAPDANATLTVPGDDREDLFEADPDNQLSMPCLGCVHHWTSVLDDAFKCAGCKHYAR